MGSDQNTLSDELIASLARLPERVGEMAASVADIRAQVTALMSVMQSDAQRRDGRLDGIERDVATVSTRVESVEQSVRSLKTDTESITRQIATFAGPIEQVKFWRRFIYTSGKILVGVLILYALLGGQHITVGTLIEYLRSL